MLCCVPCRYDESNHKRYAPGLDGKSPALLVTAAGRFFYATAARLLALKFILSMSVSVPCASHYTLYTASTCSTELSCGGLGCAGLWLRGLFADHAQSSCNQLTSCSSSADLPCPSCHNGLCDQQSGVCGLLLGFALGQSHGSEAGQRCLCMRSASRRLRAWGRVMQRATAPSPSQHTQYCYRRFL